jgi:hypothetical protein
MAKLQGENLKAKAVTVNREENSSSEPFLFNKINYGIMLAGLAVILVGFALMAGGTTTDPNVFPADEIYSFQRITLAPIVILIGFGIEIFAILKRPANA